MYEPLALLAGFTLLYSVLARRLDRTVITGPMIFLAFGIAVGPLGLGILDLGLGAEGMKSLAELTLALVLFTDAAGTDFAALKKARKLPVRLLFIGLPLTILLGYGIGELTFVHWTVIEVALLATMLAPTDAALGKGVVTNPVVPDSVRQGLNVESGLNDGICVPIILLFIALASGESAGQGPVAIGLHLVLQVIGVGVLTGVVLTGAAIWILRKCYAKEWLSSTWMQISVVALAFCCFSVSQLLGGSGFIACFVGGMLFGFLEKGDREKLLAGGEGIGDTFALLTWVMFGAVVVAPALGHFGWTTILYAVLSLTVVRMLPVFLVVTGLGFNTEGKLFMGWFGPRGLASIVFIVIVAGEKFPHIGEISMVVVCTITLSIIAHGLTATPWAKGFGERSRAAAKGDEKEPV